MAPSIHLRRGRLVSVDQRFAASLSRLRHVLDGLVETGV
jgi:hypothetical protein